MSGYQRINFKDQVVERPKTYDVTNNPDGSITLIDSFGNVEELGTPINSETMGHIEDALEEHDGRITVLENASDYDNFLNKSQITNCITEIPQRIKLELSDGTLTLKAGSEVIVPNGFKEDGITPKFDYVTVESDVSQGGVSWNGECFYFYNSKTNEMGPRAIEQVVSSATEPTGATIGIWYGTTNNIIKEKENGVWVTNLVTLPLGLATLQTSAPYIKSLNQVFNGMGYIGSVYWADKGIKVLIPDGRNEDGSLKSIVYEYPKIKIFNNSSWDTLGVLYNGYFIHLIVDGQGIDEVIFQPTSRFYSSIDSPADSAYSYAYLKDENRWYFYDGSKWIKCQVVIYANMQTKGGYFTPKEVFRAVDYNDAVLKSTPHITQTYLSGSSWYRVWSDGWIEQGGKITQTGVTVTFLKAFANTSYSVLITSVDAGCGGSFEIIGAFNRTAQSMFIQRGGPGYGNITASFTWYACGY